MYTNHPVSGPMRGFGMPEMHAGLEQCIDELALKIEMDPVEFRRINCFRGWQHPGYRQQDAPNRTAGMRG